MSNRKTCKKDIIKLVGFAICTTATLMMFSEVAFAKFDLDAGVSAATKPLIDGLEAHWGKGILLSGGGATLIGEGDGRQKAVKAAIGCAAGGAVILGLIAMLKS